jgi:hypothetical protein
MSDEKAPKTKTRQMSFTVLEDKSVRVDFGEGIDPITFQPASLPETLFPDAVAKGVIARLQSYSSSLQGGSRTPAALREKTLKGLEDLQKGIWVAEREVSSPEASIEAEAAHIFRQERAKAEGKEYTLTLDETAALYAALSDEQKVKLKATARFQAAYAKVKAARQAARAEKLSKKAQEDDSDIF